MANRRMFSNRIANSAKFLQMPSEAQLLYFHLVIRADDDGIVESYPVTKILGLASDNFKILIAKGFITQLNEDQVVVIMDWKEHNTIRADRKVDSIYLPLLQKVLPEMRTVIPKPRSDVKDNSKRINGQSTVSISQVKLSKDNTYICSFDTFWKEYPRKVAKSKCELKYKRLCISKKKEEEIMKGLKKYNLKWKVERTSKQYIPNPMTWLNQERWIDEIEIIRSTDTRFVRENEKNWEKAKQKEKDKYDSYKIDDGNGGLVKLSDIVKK